MTGHEFDRSYWDEHYAKADTAAGHRLPPNPYLVEEVGNLPVGSALEAGCGEGAEAIWLAQAGWQVTAVDIATEPLARAAGRAEAEGVGDRIEWVRADLGSWQPARTYDLVTTHYAHPAMPQLELYDRLSAWVAPGGTLLVVGHLQSGHAGHLAHGAPDGRAAHAGSHDDRPPAEASVTAKGITERLEPATWEVVTAVERTRTLDGTGCRHDTLQDVVVRAVRRAAGPP
jgi:trans-aconitate methyltransferase